MAVGARRVAMDFGRFHEDERRGWNKARVLNATDVHLLVACLPAWCSYPWTADARVDLVSLLLALARVRVHAWLRGSARGRVGGGRRVGKQVAPKPQPWAVAVKYCGCFKNRSFHPRSPRLLARQSSVETRSLSTLCRKICRKTPRDEKPAEGNSRKGDNVVYRHRCISKRRSEASRRPSAFFLYRRFVLRLVSRALSTSCRCFSCEIFLCAHYRNNDSFREKIE